MKYFNELWLGVFGLLAIFIFIEGLHMYEHEHCRSCPECPLTEEY